jgi:hypothetical protein
MTRQRRRKHKYAYRLGVCWRLFHEGRWAAVFSSMALHFETIMLLPNLHPPDCRFCREIGIWLRIP